MRRVAYLAALAGVAVSLAGCQSFEQAAGLSKETPDAFAVATKAPLIIPPDYNLRPPAPGAAPTNQIGPTTEAEDVLYGKQPQVSSGVGPFTSGERAFLAKAGATDANNMIRQKIAADNHAMQAADNSFTNQILFGMNTNTAYGKNVNAEAEHKRLEAGEPAKTEALPGDKSSSGTKDSGGWLDGLF